MSKQGLDASGHLLLAEGHLLTAQDSVERNHRTPHGARAAYWTRQATLDLRKALRLLRLDKEEPCKP